MSETKQTELQSDANRNAQRKKILSILAAVFIGLGLIFSLYWLCVGQFYESTDDAYVSGNRIEVMPQITGNVTSILADETDSVKKGDVLITLDKSDAQVALQKAASQLAMTVLNVNQLYDSVDQLKANVALQAENLKKAQTDYDRRKGLEVNQVISEEDLSHAKTAAATAENALNVAQSKMKETLALIGHTDLYQHPQILQAETNLRNAFLNVERTTIYAPESGYVAKRPVQVGQEVNPTKVLMIIVPLNQVWVEANFKESQLKNMHAGQSVEIISDAYGSDVKFKGKVVGLGAGTGSAFDLLPPQNATGNWIKVVQRVPVRLAMDADQLKQYPLQIGLSVTATVNTHHRKGDALLRSAQERMTYHGKDYSADTTAADQMIHAILQENAKDRPAPVAE